MVSDLDNGLSYFSVKLLPQVIAYFSSMNPRNITERNICRNICNHYPNALQAIININ